jgi:hypothetical protein
MALTNDTETHRTATTVVRVRIPDGTSGDLTTEASRRLTRIDGVLSANIDGVRELSPGLSATAITARVTVELTSGTAVESHADAPFVTVTDQC